MDMVQSSYIQLNGAIHTMAKLSDTITCPRCGKEFLWDYHIPDYIGKRMFDVEILNQNAVHARRMNSVKSSVFELRLRCKYCDESIEFTYTPNNGD